MIKLYVNIHYIDKTLTRYPDHEIHFIFSFIFKIRLNDTYETK